MANEQLLFRKGTLANLQANELTNKVAGSINFTTDEPAIYLDVEEGNGEVVRKRVGDLITFEKLSDFESYLNTHQKLPLTALYYITETNALLKYTGAEGAPWKQLNSISDISAEVSGLQSSLTNLNNSFNNFKSDVYDKNVIDGKLADKADISYVDGKLADKADTSYVDGKLVDKADKGNFDNFVNSTNSTLGEKADKSYVDGELDKKANKSYVDEKLDEKADKSYVDEKLNEKAGKEEFESFSAGVNATLDLKANAADVTAALNLKADTADVNAALGDKADQTALEQVVANASATYETKDDAALKLQTAEAAVKALKEGEVAANTTAIGTEKTRAEEAEKGLGESITAVSKTVDSLNSTTSASIKALQDKDTELTTAISTAKTEAINDVRGNAENDTENSLTIYGVKKALAEKDQATNDRITNINNTLNGAITDAINTVTGDEDNDTKDSLTIHGVRKYVDDYVDTALVAADAMKFIGVLGKGENDIQELPAAEDTQAGDTYKIGTSGKYAGYDCYVGDLLIAQQDGSNQYYHITSGYEDEYNTRLGVNAEANKVVLNSVVGAAHGSVTFKGNENSNISVIVSGTEDVVTHQADSTVTFAFTWGSF